MIDELSQRYEGMLSGSYDCVDRIVLNAYFSLGHNPGAAGVDMAVSCGITALMMRRRPVGLPADRV
jgi:hypothetical protein